MKPCEGLKKCCKWRYALCEITRSFRRSIIPYGAPEVRSNRVASAAIKKAFMVGSRRASQIGNPGIAKGNFPLNDTKCYRLAPG